MTPLKLKPPAGSSHRAASHLCMSQSTQRWEKKFWDFKHASLLILFKDLHEITLKYLEELIEIRHRILLFRGFTLIRAEKNSIYIYITIFRKKDRGRTLPEFFLK